MSRGYSLLELLVVITLIAIASAIAVPTVWSSVESARASAAARYVASRLALNRMEAVKRSRFVALRFEPGAEGYRFGAYVDGNHNGVRSADVARNIDTRLGLPTRLEDHFSGVSFGLYANVLPVAAGDSLADGDPVRIGRSEYLSFSPLGSATAGTLYLRGRGGHQLAVRVLGVTGRVRVLRFDFSNRRWVTP